MHPRYHLPLFVLFITVTIASVSAADDERYLNCSAPFHCADMQDIGYPFWGLGRAAYCGHPGFELTNCSTQNPPEIKIKDLRYQVLDMYKTPQTITVLRTDYSQNLCPNLFHNTSLDANFTYTLDTKNITLHYDCTTPAPSQLSGLQFNCSLNDSTTPILNFFTTTAMAAQIPPTLVTSLGSCKYKVDVSVNESEIQTLTQTPSLADLLTALRKGFGLQWDPNMDRMCSECESSGGQCGYNGATSQFSCFCKDGAYTLACGRNAASPTPESAPNSKPTLLVLLFLLLLLHSTAADPLTGCNLSFSCGSLSNLSYPFTGAARPSHRGPLPSTSPAKKTTSLSSPPLIPSLTVSSTTTRPPKPCASQDQTFSTPCAPNVSSTHLSTPLSSPSSPPRKPSLFYGCNESAIFSRAETVFSCPTNGADSNNDSFFLFGSVPSITSSFDIHCRTSVNVPILITWSHQVGAKRSLLEVLRYGFNVSYSNPYAPNCDVCAKSGGQCGFDADLGKPTCICGGTFTKRLTIIIGITSTIGVLILVSIVAIYFKRRELSSVVGMIIWRKNSKCNEKIEAFMSNHSFHTPQRYSYSEVKRMTSSFTTKLGQGGFGSVYKGKLLDGRLVAVKMLDKSKADGEEFINEVASISRTNHINVVTMLGFCYDGRCRALIYEYMPNGSLDKLIFHRGIDRNKRSTHPLEWKVLFEIAVGIAKGLEYLHAGCNIRIVHFDIKPHNILLDEDFCPKISDFGLAKLRNRNESMVSLTGAKGTIGYIAPEIVFRSYGGVSSKSDVYSYGIMILEMVGGRTGEIDDEGCSNSSEIYFPDQFYKYFKLEDLSTIYGVLTNDEENVARKMILVGLWCIQTNPSSRPSMVKVVDMLEGSLESLQIPPKPYLYPPTILIQENSTMASSTRYTESQMDEQMISIM